MFSSSNVSPHLLGVLAHALQSFEAGLAPHLEVRCEMIAGVNDHPLAAQPLASVHVAMKITVDPIADMRRDLCDVDGRQRMDADADAMSLAGLANGRHPLIRQRLDRVRRDVDLQVEVSNVMAHGGLEAVFDSIALPEIDADAASQIHVCPLLRALEHFPEKWAPVFRRKCDH
jgi:hypothetical protein